MCTVEAMKLKIVQLKEALAAKLNCGCEDDGKIPCNWQLVGLGGTILAENQQIQCQGSLGGL